MNKSTWYWIIGGVALIGTLIFFKVEIARNRRALTDEVGRVIEEAPAKVVQVVTQGVATVLGTNAAAPASGGASNKSDVQNALGSALDVFVKAGQQAVQAVTSNAPTSSAGGGQSKTQDVVGTLLDLAANTGRQVDQAVLGKTELTDAQEIEVGNQLDKDLAREMPEAADPATLAELERLAAPLLEQRQRKQIGYRIRILRSSQVNAFGAAGGHIYLTTAFLREFPSESERAMTIGHEIAHVDLKHSVHKVQYEYHAQKVVGNAAKIGQIAYALLSTPYTKDQEFEADAAGFDACRKAGWSSESLLSLFEHLAKWEREHQRRSRQSPEATSEMERRFASYFSSHPETEERLARLRKKAAE